MIDYIMPLKAILLRQLEIVLEKALDLYHKAEEKLRCHGYLEIAYDLEFILNNLDVIQFKEPHYDRTVQRRLKWYKDEERKQKD